jgi:DNA-binding XRE family transcriptional regulator
MLNGVEYLLDSVGVETRASDKIIFHAFSISSSQMTYNMTTQNLHIGQLVKAVFDESGMTVSEFARQIHLERSTIYGIFERPSIDSMLLVKISLVLKHNFLSDIEQHFGLIPTAPSLTLHLDHLSPETALQLADLLNERGIFQRK